MISFPLDFAAAGDEVEVLTFLTFSDLGLGDDANFFTFFGLVLDGDFGLFFSINSPFSAWNDEKHTVALILFREGFREVSRGEGEILYQL